MSQSIDRLENLIRVLRGVAPDEFNMSNWCNCAVGHASREQYFIDEGLSISGLGESPMAKGERPNRASNSWSLGDSFEKLIIR